MLTYILRYQHVVSVPVVNELARTVSSVPFISIYLTSINFYHGDGRILLLRLSSRTLGPGRRALSKSHNATFD